MSKDKPYGCGSEPGVCGNPHCSKTIEVVDERLRRRIICKECGAELDTVCWPCWQSRRIAILRGEAKQ